MPVRIFENLLNFAPVGDFIGCIDASTFPYGCLIGNRHGQHVGSDPASGALSLEGGNNFSGVFPEDTDFHLREAFLPELAEFPVERFSARRVPNQLSFLR